MIRKKDLVNFRGQMEDHIRDIGKMANKMGREHTGTNRDCKKMEHG